MKLGCEALGINCGYTATGSTAKEVKQKIIRHGKAAHKAELAKMTKKELTAMSQKIDTILAK